MGRLFLRSLVCLFVLAWLLAAGCAHRSSSPTATRGPRIAATLKLTPKPDFLWTTAPGAGETLSVEEYELLGPSSGWGATLPSVCFSVDPWPLLEAGESPTIEEWLARVSVIIDGRAMDAHHSLFETDMPGGVLLDPNTGDVVKRAPDGSPFGLCYAATLEVGVHIVTLNVTEQSGEAVTYDWSFELVE